MKAVALTDHGVLHGIPELFRECRKHGIKPIAGNEMYFAPDGRGTKEGHFHQLVLVKNKQGWKNLLKLTSEAFLTGFHGKPRIDWELLREHHEGLILTSSCLAGMIPQAILNGEYKKAREIAKQFHSLMGDDFYLEIQPTDTPSQEMVNKEIEKISKELNIQVIATGDVHYVLPEDMVAHLGMLCLGRDQKMSEIKGYDGEENYYLKSAKEMYVALKKQGFEQQFIVDALNNTGKIADKIDFELVKEKDHLPAFPLEDGMTPDILISQMVKEGLMRKIEKPTKKHIERIKFELGVIREKGLQDYFLIVADAIKKGKELGIMFAPARGSGAGSIVSYLLDITEVDPIKHGLFFERFLDITRKKMPDIDTDIEDERRYEIIDYLKDKYGERRVAQIANYTKMKPKGAFKSALQVYDIPFGESMKITGLVEGDSIEEAYKLSPQLKSLRKGQVKDNKGNPVKMELVFDLAERFEGVLSSLGKHAGGVLITPTDIDDFFPIFKPSVKDPYIVVQWDKDDIEELGGIKFDFLGLQTLRTISMALRSIENETGKKIDVNKIVRGEMDDPLVYERIQQGLTANSFQLNSSGMQELCKKVKPTEFSHIVAINALYRPPALASGDTWRYARIKNGEEQPHYSHPDEQKITGETYGVITYQEHVMQLVHHFAGWEYSIGDKLRKASQEDLEGMRDDFIRDCDIKGYFYCLDDMDELWTRIVNYMGYGFNKSHGVAYSMISYLTVFLEAHYPEHWKAAIMTAKMGEQDKIAQIFTEIKREGFEFQAPDINKSDLIFTANKGKIVFPLGMVKGVGDGAIKELMEHRPFSSLEDLMERCNLRLVSARAMKPLVLSGAFDSLYEGYTRKEILIKYYELKKEKKATIETHRDMDWSEDIQAEHEKELLGVYISNHPMQKYHFRDWREYEDGQRGCLVGGLVGSVKSFKDKKGNRMAFVTLETLEGSRKLVVFGHIFPKVEKFLVKGNALMVNGQKEGEQLKVDTIKELI